MAERYLDKWLQKCSGEGTNGYKNAAVKGQMVTKMQRGWDRWLQKCSGEGTNGYKNAAGKGQMVTKMQRGKGAA
jgi:hypothetical protein